MSRRARQAEQQGHGPLGRLYGVWRFAHLEGITNGLLVLGVAAVWHLMDLQRTGIVVARWLLVVGCYANIIGPIVTALLIYDLFGYFGPFHIAAVVSLVTIIFGEPREINYWSAYATVGGNIRSGNTDQTDLTGYGYIRRESALTRFQAEYTGAYSVVERSGAETSAAVRFVLAHPLLFARNSVIRAAESKIRS